MRSPTWRRRTRSPWSATRSTGRSSHAGQSFTPFLVGVGCRARVGHRRHVREQGLQPRGIQMRADDRGIRSQPCRTRRDARRGPVPHEHPRLPRERRRVHRVRRLARRRDRRDRPVGRAAHAPCSPSTCPRCGYTPPRASYLAWLDFRELGWGDDPAARALEVARVALNSGHVVRAVGRGIRPAQPRLLPRGADGGGHASGSGALASASASTTASPPSGGARTGRTAATPSPSPSASREGRTLEVGLRATSHRARSG